MGRNTVIVVPNDSLVSNIISPRWALIISKLGKTKPCSFSGRLYGEEGRQNLVFMSAGIPSPLSLMLIDTGFECLLVIRITLGLYPLSFVDNVLEDTA
jgi:hypothetical protein